MFLNDGIHKHILIMYLFFFTAWSNIEVFRQTFKEIKDFKTVFLVLFLCILK